MRRVTVEAGALDRDEVPLDAGAAHHLKDVLRLPEGELLELCDGAGVRARGELRAGRIVVVERDPPRPRPRCEVTVLQGWAKGEKMDRVVRPVAELGALRFVPVHTARSVPKGGGKPDRWRAIAEDALRVSGRAYRMRVEAPQRLADLASAPADPNRLDVVFDGRGDEALADLPATPPAAARLLVGPEGGFEASELDVLRGRGFRVVRLGAANLRTETAAPAALAALTLGRWGAS